MSVDSRTIAYRWARVVFTGMSIVATGVLLFKYTTPTDEELIAKFSPEVRAEYEKNREIRRREQEELMKIVKKTAASNDPIWYTGSIKSPFERDTRGIDPKLVDRETFHKEKAQEFKKQEAEKAKKEFEEAEFLRKSKKRWWIM